MTDSPTYTSLGKEVLRRGQHFADAIDPGAASDIATAMNRHESDPPAIPFDNG